MLVIEELWDEKEVGFLINLSSEICMRCLFLVRSRKTLLGERCFSLDWNNVKSEFTELVRFSSRVSTI